MAHTITLKVGTITGDSKGVDPDPSKKLSAAKTHVLKLTVAPRTAPPVLSLTLNATLQSDGVHLSWSKYTGPFFQYELS